MINQASLEAVAAAHFKPPFIRPLYETYNFWRLPHSIVRWFGGETNWALPSDALPSGSSACDAVVLLLIDGFGWRFYEPRAERYPFLQHFVRHGVVSKLTSMFPSTTAAHLTTLHTGLPPAHSGVYEWYQHAPTLNAMIAPLTFSLAGERGRDTLAQAGVSPGFVFPTHVLYQQLIALDVDSFVLQSNQFAHSAPSRHLVQGARIVATKTTVEGCVQLSKLLAAQQRRSYYVLYLSQVDAIGHEYGPTSEEIEAEIDVLLRVLEEHLLNRLAQHGRVLLLVTADHGLVETNPATTLYLNRDENLRTLRRHLQTDWAGQPLAPAGSPRDLFLHIRPDKLERVERTLSEHLAGRALVFQTRFLIEQGLFGPPPISDRFLERVGNLVILPFKGESVYWYERGRFEQTFFGHHGGLTREEMEIPLLACAL
ncbi:MAG: alkaline phosphatase family protein [Anaerolineae bacterium]|nr:alkaline phosphatase family protein [Thermoflexales bacterium]MDW8408298.1 alkaline phosphatase family protein [Anaerolineae bacterium]